MKTILVFGLLLLPLGLHAQQEGLRAKHFNVKKNIALEGYDPVSYFKGSPSEGDDDITLTHRGVVYFFSSEKNRALFRAEPDKYEPAFGGWCAYAMGANGEKVKVDPETFKIVNGKLYLFYNFWGNNTLEDWNANESKLLAAADGNWKTLFR
jgi:YHS domain-containing protein